jgi:hypothetical protein
MKLVEIVARLRGVVQFPTEESRPPLRSVAGTMDIGGFYPGLK